MEIRTFTGASLAEAIGQLKQELGEEAVILSSRRAEDPALLPPGHLVEVLAALPAPPAGRPPRSEAPRPWRPRPLREASATPAPEPPAAAPPDGLKELRGELEELRRSLRELAPHARPVLRGAERGERHQQGLRRLCGLGMSPQTAGELLDGLDEGGDERARERALTAALARLLPCSPREEPASGRRVEALVGPSGVGKTTLVAKLLLHREGPPHRRAGILSLDTRRVAAVDQARRLAGILRVPLELVYRPGELGAALERLAGCDLVLVDTPGAGPRERLALERVRALLRELRPVRVHLALPATMRLEDQLAAVAAWREAGADRLIAAKLDEAAGLGGLADLARQADLPFSYAGLGQRIPDDLARLEARLLARWILHPESLGASPDPLRTQAAGRLAPSESRP
jgi:flagellar biosynthesis protein FlhF